jgi:hypothetical protein
MDRKQAESIASELLAPLLAAIEADDAETLFLYDKGRDLFTNPPQLDEPICGLGVRWIKHGVKHGHAWRETG